MFLTRVAGDELRREIQNTPVLQVRPTPDEAIIQSRGRRVIPRTFSPDRAATPPNRKELDTVKTRHFHRPRHLSKLSPSTVRRRLFDDEEEEDGEVNVDFMKLPVIRKKGDSSPEEVRHNVKKLKTTSTSVNINNNDVSQEEDPLVLAKALSKDQLLELLSRLTLETSDMPRLRMMLPAPDITARLTNLTYLMHNIYRSIPHNRLSRNMDTVNRCKIQWAVFRKAMTEDLTELQDSKQWSTVLDYVMSAWESVMMGPGDHAGGHSEQSVRNICLRQLASVIMRVAKQYDISPDLRTKLAEMMVSGSSVQDVRVCREFLLSNNK